jgi:hypothetical protein
VPRSESGLTHNTAIRVDTGFTVDQRCLCAQHRMGAIRVHRVSAVLSLQMFAAAKSSLGMNFY